MKCPYRDKAPVIHHCSFVQTRYFLNVYRIMSVKYDFSGVNPNAVGTIVHEGIVAVLAFLRSSEIHPYPAEREHHS